MELHFDSHLLLHVHFHWHLDAPHRPTLSRSLAREFAFSDTRTHALTRTLTVQLDKSSEHNAEDMQHITWLRARQLWWAKQRDESRTMQAHARSQLDTVDAARTCAKKASTHNDQTTLANARSSARTTVRGRTSINANVGGKRAQQRQQPKSKSIKEQAVKLTVSMSARQEHEHARSSRQALSVTLIFTRLLTRTFALTIALGHGNEDGRQLQSRCCENKRGTGVSAKRCRQTQAAAPVGKATAMLANARSSARTKEQECGRTSRQPDSVKALQEHKRARQSRKADSVKVDAAKANHKNNKV